MREVSLFVEDYAHKQVIGALVTRLAGEYGAKIQLDWRSAVRGYGRVARELGRYLDDLGRQDGRPPDLIVAATDANCVGLNPRRSELQNLNPPAPMILAIPDPHIERWLLLDGAALKAAIGKGCDAPDQKCSRDRYKQLLANAVRDAGIMPNFGGVEFAEDIVREMDMARAARADGSFKRFIDDLKAVFRNWQ